MIELIKDNKIEFQLNTDLQGIEDMLMYIKELNNKNVKSPKLLYSGTTRNFEIELDTDVDELIISKDVVKIYMDDEELEYFEERLKNALISRCFYPAEMFEKKYKNNYATIYCDVTMKYLLLQFEEEKYWFELDDEGFAYRQIVSDEYNRMHVSCLEDCLAEGQINEEDIDGSIIHLTKQEFDTLWQSVIKKYRKQWEGIKKRYPVGAYVQGVNSYSYPQGTIIRGNDFVAIYTGDEPFCLNKLVQYKVKAYDDMDMWLVVG